MWAEVSIITSLTKLLYHFQKENSNSTISVASQTNRAVLTQGRIVYFPQNIKTEFELKIKKELEKLISAKSTHDESVPIIRRFSYLIRQIKKLHAKYLAYSNNLAAIDSDTLQEHILREYLG